MVGLVSRERCKACSRLDSFAGLGVYTATQLPDGCVEVHVGDLVSAEQRIAIFLLQMMPIPLIAPGRPAATLDGEALAEIEVVYDEITNAGANELGAFIRLWLKGYFTRVWPLDPSHDADFHSPTL